MQNLTIEDVIREILLANRLIIDYKRKIKELELRIETFYMNLEATFDQQKSIEINRLNEELKKITEKPKEEKKWWILELQYLYQLPY